MVCQLVLNFHIYVQLCQGCLLRSNSLRLPWKALVVKKFSAFYWIPKVYYSPHKKNLPTDLILDHINPVHPLAASFPYYYPQTYTLISSYWQTKITWAHLTAPMRATRPTTAFTSTNGQSETWSWSLHNSVQPVPSLSATHLMISTILLSDAPYASVSQPFWDRGPVNSFFMRRGPYPNKFTRKYLSIFLSSYIKLT